MERFRMCRGGHQRVSRAGESVCLRNFWKGGESYMTHRSKQFAAVQTPNYTGPFITVSVLFFIFGFITTLNMALVPHLRSVFSLNYAWAMLADSAFFLAYFIFSAPTSKL